MKYKNIFVAMVLAFILSTVSVLADEGLDIIDTSVSVTVNNNAPVTFVNGPADITVSPGDRVTVQFQYNNSLDGLIIGHVEIRARSNLMPDPFVYRAGKWSLLPQTPTTHEFSFTVPYETVSDFVLTIRVEDEDEEGEDYSDEQVVNFILQQEAQDVHINSVAAADANLTCTRATDILVNATSTGEREVVPEVFIFDARATMDEDGDFDREPEFEHYDFSNILAPGTTRLEMIEDVNLSSLAAGTHNVYVYIVSPFFWRGVQEGFEFHENIVPITVGPCLKTQEIENVFTFNKNGNGDSIGLLGGIEDTYFFLNEDRLDDLDSLTFSVTGQSDDDLTNCFVDHSALTCSAPSEDAVGESIINMTITYLDGENVLSEIMEQFTVSVREGIELRNVRINGMTEAQIKELGLTARPLQNLVVTFTVKNALDEPVTGINVQLQDDDADDGFQFNIDEDVNFHLNANQESTTQTITVPLPVNVPAGDYDLSLVAEGQTLDDRVQTDSFDLEIHVEPLASEIVLHVDVAEGLEELTCEPETTLNVEYSNSGLVDENDIVLQVKERNEVVYNSMDANNGQFLPLSRGQTQQRQIPITVRGVSDHTYTVELLYNFDDEGEIPASRAAPQTVQVTKNGCIVSFTPIEQLLLSEEGGQLDFSVELGESGNSDLLTWFVNDETVQQGGNLYTLQRWEMGSYAVRVVYNEDEDESSTWDVIISNVPLSFSGTLQTNVPDDATDDDLLLFEDFTIRSQFGQIHFLEPVDISSLVDLDDVVRIGQGFISIDSEFAPDLNVPARITMNNFQQGRTFIYRYEAFGNPAQLQGRQRCEAPQCQVVSHNDTVLIFDVQSFSTYLAVNEREVAIDAVPTEPAFTDVTRGQNANTTFVLRNSGTLNPMTGITIDASGIASQYNIQVQNMPRELQPGQEQTVTLQITVPADENAGKHTIGSLKIDSAETAETLVPLFITPKSFLKIESVKINGKTTGELEPDNKENKIEVKVKNEYTRDMDDVVVTVKILDVDSDDLEEESDSFEVKNGKSEETTLTFDLAGETLDEEDYTVEITVEGEADDGSEHQAVESKNVNVQRERHKVIFKRIAASATTLQCLRQTAVDVDVENVGKNDEDDVEIRFKNGALNINEVRKDISLDKYSDSDNDYQTTFTADLEKAQAGSYPFTLEVSTDGKVTDTETVTIVVEECLTTKRTEDLNKVQAQASAELAKQLQEQLKVKQTQPVPQKPVVTTTFRESSTYILLLGVLVVFIFIALVLGLAVLVLKKKN